MFSKISKFGQYCIGYTADDSISRTNFLYPEDFKTDISGKHKHIYVETLYTTYIV